MPLEQVWDVFLGRIYETNLLFGLRVHAFVVMPNHFHMLATASQNDLGQVMMHFMRSVTKSLNLDSGRSGRVFGERYHWTLINSTTYFGHALKYVYRNPVKAGLSERVEEYRYSTIGAQLGFRALPIPLYYPFGFGSLCLLPDEASAEFLEWLNRPFRERHDELIRNALKKTCFQTAKEGSRRDQDPLCEGLL